MDVRVDVSELGAFFGVLARQMRAEVARAVWEAADAGAAEARNSAHFQDRSEDLRARTQARAISMEEAEIVADTPYAHFVEWGTSPHLIHARNKGTDGEERYGALRFEIGGEVLYRPYVFHPGTAADGFMARGRDRAEQVLRTGIEGALSRSVRRVAA